MTNLKQNSSTDGTYSGDNEVILMPKQHVTVDFTPTQGTKTQISYAHLTIKALKTQTIIPHITTEIVAQEMTGDTPWMWTCPDNYLRASVRLDHYRVVDGTSTDPAANVGDVTYTPPPADGAGDTGGGGGGGGNGDIDTTTTGWVIAGVIVLAVVLLGAYLFLRGRDI